MQSAPQRTLPPEEKRESIFRAAREVIAERGFDRATMEEIAARAAVGKGTLYNFFTSKEDLFLSLVIDGFQETRDLIDAEVAPIQDPWERLDTAWRTLLLQVFPELSRRWNFNYQLWGLLARDPAAREKLFGNWRLLYREREQGIAEAIVEGQREGLFRKNLHPESVALLLMAVFDGLLHRTMFDPDRVDPDAALAAILDLLHNALAVRGPRGTRR